MKKLIATLMACAMVLSLCACGSGVTQEEYDSLKSDYDTLQADYDSLQSDYNTLQSDYDTLIAEQEAEAEEPEEEPEEEASTEVDCIDFECEDGYLVYTGYEKADKKLTDYDNALIFCFDFTNYAARPGNYNSAFYIQFFQNGVELEQNYSWNYCEGNDQWELINATYDDVMKDATAPCGFIVVPEDDSPITVMVGCFTDYDTYQMMEVSLTDGGSAASESAVSAEDVDAALQGEWLQGGSNTFTFDDGAISIEGGGTEMNGTYEVNVNDSTIDGTFEATDGTVTIHLPFIYENGELTLMNNNNEELVKQ